MDRRRFLNGVLAAGAAAAAPRLAQADELPLGPLPGTRYPDPRVEALDRRFKYKIGNAYIERVATGMRWSEGPVYFRDGGYLVWSDIPNNRMMRWSEEDGHVSTFRYPSNYANGNTRDREGRLVTCEHDTRRVTRTEHDGTVTVLMDKFQGKALNSPNDIVVTSDGSTWFTDPRFGISGNYEGHKADPELPPNVYRLDPRTGRATVVYAPETGQPNGIAFSPDEKKLYVIVMAFPDNRPSEIRVFDVNGERLSNGRTFATTKGGNTDGMRLDVDGNIWCGMGNGDPSQDGVHCYAPTGDLIGKIHLPETCANLCFGGKKNNRLFMAASTSVYSLYVDTVGAQAP